MADRLAEIAEKYGLTDAGVDYALHQYEKVLYEITDGALSKLSYDADDVIRYAQDRWCDKCDRIPAWISVEDRLPENGPPDILVYDPENGARVCKRLAKFKCAGKVMYFDDPGLIDFAFDQSAGIPDVDDMTHITHWMPLPERPMEDK